jgi:hypothetical protein
VCYWVAGRCAGLPCHRGLRRLGVGCVHLTALRTLDLSRTCVVRLPNAALWGVESLERIALPSTPEEIGRDSCTYCGLWCLEAKGTRLAEIGDGAFRQCQRLCHVSLPRTLEHCGALTFGHCPIASTPLVPGPVARGGVARLPLRLMVKWLVVSGAERRHVPEGLFGIHASSGAIALTTWMTLPMPPPLWE